MDVVDNVFVEQFEESSLASISQQKISYKSFCKAHQIAEVFGWVDVVQRAHSQRKESLNARLDEKMLRISRRKDQKGNNESG